MTLIAALKIEGVPAMIGDFLLTDEQFDAAHIYRPTRPNVSDPRIPRVPGVPNLPRRLAGIRRKIHIINDQFIVGFTGDEMAGAQIFARLEQSFGHSNQGPSIEDVDRVLRLFNIQFNKHATVIGWTARSRPRCFAWTAGPGSHAKRVDYAIEGSGKKHFLENLASVRSFGYSPDVRTAFDKAILFGLARAGDVLCEEINSGQNLAFGYGYGAEIALFTGSRFEMIPKFGYAFLKAQIGDDGTPTFSQANTFAVYESKGRYSLVSVTRLIPGDGVMTATDTYIAAMRPLHDNMPQLSPAVTGVPDPVCPFYVNEIEYVDTRTNTKRRIRATSNDHPEFLHLAKRNGLVHFEWNRDKLVKMVNHAVNHSIAIGKITSRSGGV